MANLFRQRKNKIVDNRFVPNKGLKGQRCNRNECNNTGANWYNKRTRSYYCSECAHNSEFIDPREFVYDED